MSHRNRFLLVAIGAIGLLAAPMPSSAQDASSDWSLIRMRPIGCVPEVPCPAAAGLIWDSTNVAPTWPAAMRAVGVGGDLVLAFDVREDGRVDPSSVAIVRTSHEAFVRSAREAVSGWRFAVDAPGRPAGVLPVEVQLIYAHEGVCESGQRPQHTGWAARNQLVMGACVTRIPYSQMLGKQ